jgi:dynein heavy chain
VRVNKFDAFLEHSAKSISKEVELQMPSTQYALDDLGLDDNKLRAAWAKAAMHTDTLMHYEFLVENWSSNIERILMEKPKGETDDAEPNSEYDFWRQRIARINSIVEQVKRKQCRTVIGVLSIPKSKVLKRWKQLENSITDALNEAKDNNKYLSTIEKYTEPLYSDNPLLAMDVLPALMNNIKMMHTIARYYRSFCLSWLDPLLQFSTCFFSNLVSCCLIDNRVYMVVTARQNG